MVGTAFNVSQRSEMLRKRYAKSREMLARAQRTIPLGSQTFSKSHIQYPECAPLFLERGSGSHVWDVDGNEYIDFVSALAPVILGYDDTDVISAVTEQLHKGVSFSLPTPLEAELAEMLVDIIPCAEMVRFGKNGTDATSAAIRLARAYTKRDRVAVCGYHGWQDWYIGSTARHLGVPDAVRELTSTFQYNNLESLRNALAAHPGEFAAVIMEPLSVDPPEPGFLEGVRDLAHEHGALFVLDEIITGFRVDLGGAQTLTGVTPDLASFGKSMANGFPMAAIVGKAEYMRLMEDIFYSGTFGGEALSLAASIATIQKMQREPVHQRLNSAGERIMAKNRELISRHGLEEYVMVKGHPTWNLLIFKDGPKATLWETKSLYLEELLAQGILFIGSHNMSYAHSDSDLEKLAQAQDAAFGLLRQALDHGNVRDYLTGPPMEPLFRVR
jgi:glutamate-1-semialdehyde 2,1-aminomutase